MSSERVAALKAHFDTPGQAPRPILTSLNGDNSWLMSFPRPAKERADTGKAYYHVVSDAWLVGPAVTLSSWMVWINLTAPPVAKDGNDVEDMAREIENAASASGIINSGTKMSSDSSVLDAIFINFHYLDHMHEATMRTFNPNLPVFASPEAAPVVRGWNHFSTVTLQKDLDPAGGSWQDLHPGSPLPSWLSVFRLVGHHELNFATAFVWSPDGADGKHEALVYSPHGIRMDQPTLQAFLHKADPPISTLAMLHTLKDNYAFGRQLTSGVDGGLALERVAKPKYWIKTHDSELTYWGLIMKIGFVYDIFRTLESGLEVERGLKEKEGITEEATTPNLVDVANGTCIVLE